ncbi:MAG: L,D-transpeptidase family protein [Firmicutes bacterium]|nr:L,D-transpeptidase family protein [Bacillota bacterium]
MKLLLLLTTTIPLLFPSIPHFDPDEVWVQIDLWEQQLHVKEGPHTLTSFPVAIGKEKTPTPIGEWRVTDIASGWGGGFGSHWIGLNVPWGQYGIHGTNRPTSVGRRASHGCVRMRNSDVQKLYSMVSVGMPVKIEGPILGEDRGLPKRLVRGDRGSIVLLIQNRLYAAGYYHGKMDGIFGALLEQGVKQFQKDRQREVTGQIQLGDYLELGLIE